MKKIIFDNEICLSEQELLAYAQGNSDTADTRRVELHVADCPLCSDALEGLQNTDIQTFIQDNKEIKTTIREKYFPSKLRIVFSQKNIRIAAGMAALIFGVWFLMNPTKKEISIANNESKTKQEEPITQIIDSQAIASVITENLSPQKSKVKEEDSKKLKEDKEESIAGKNSNAKIPAAPTAVTKPAEGNPSVTTSGRNGFDSIKMDNDKYVTHQNSYDPSSSRDFPSSPSKDVLAKTNNKEKEAKKKTNNPAAKSKANPKVNIEYSYETQLQDGIQEYQKNRPKQAIELFDKVLAKDPTNENALFYKGAAQANDGRCFDAITTLERFNTSFPDGSAANIEATWLIANCRLQLMQRESAILLLKQLAENYNARQDDAKRLLEKIGAK